MRRDNYNRYFFVGMLMFVSIVVSAQFENSGSSGLFYKKKELNSGARFGVSNDREELRTDESRSYEEVTSGEVNFQFSNRYWKFVDYLQQQLSFDFEVGPFGGTGNWIDSSFTENRTADHNLFGIRASIAVDYANRYYYNRKNYTLVELNGWGQFDWYNQNSTGMVVDSNGVASEFNASSVETKFRYGFDMKAGWGWGRLDPMNNYMLADYLLGKYYPGRSFSTTEIKRVAAEIHRIKANRNVATGHNNETEASAITNFLNREMLLTLPGDIGHEWEMAEFLPRVSGSRVETGPFFRYFNREPDFVYGGFVQYENSKYCSVKWNRDFGAGISYNGYKRNDWIAAELKIGWSFFPDLKRQFDFGVKYVPSVTIDTFSGFSDIDHGLVPYIGYFSQTSAKARVNLTFAYRISDDDKMMVPGPEFSLSVYRSRY